MNEITSLNNEIIIKTAKLQQKKYREENGIIIFEGEKAVDEALNNDLRICNIFVNKAEENLLKKYSSEELICVNEKILKKISDTKSVPKVVATAFCPDNKITDLPQNNSVILLVENIKDAGNLGTIIRTAAAFGIDGIILLGDTVDLYSPKVIRSSVGYIFKIPIYCTKNFKEIKNYFINHKFYATSVDEKLPVKDLKSADIKKPCVISFGCEATGLTNEILQNSDIYVKIPLEQDVESLNLSMSIGIVLYEFKR